MAGSMKAESKVKPGRVAIVTGASSGIGLGITRALSERGYRIIANSRTISERFWQVDAGVGPTRGWHR